MDFWMDLGPNLVGFWMVWRSPCDAFVGPVAGLPLAVGYQIWYIMCGRSYLIDHICDVIDDLSYMTYHVWSVICDMSYMMYHTWHIIDDLSYMIYHIWYPTARGNPATGPTNASQGDRQTIQKPTKLGYKSNQKSNKMDAKMVQNRSQEASWRGLGGSWGHLGSKMAPRSKKPPKINFWGPLLGGMLGPKISKNRSQERSRRWWFFHRFLDRLLEPFCSNLAPTWLPKPSQNGAKLVPKSMQVGVSIWRLFLQGSLHYFYWFFASTWHGRSSKKHCKM